LKSQVEAKGGERQAIIITGKKGGLIEKNSEGEVKSIERV